MDAEAECAVREGRCALRVHGTGQVSAASLGGQEMGSRQLMQAGWFLPCLCLAKQLAIV